MGLTSAQAGAMVGVSASTWRDYVADGRAPQPDLPKVGRNNMWSKGSVQEYLAGRKGQGARTDLPEPDEMGVRAPRWVWSTTSGQRAEHLVALWDAGHRALGFVENADGTTVHVLAHEDDFPVLTTTDRAELTCLTWQGQWWMVCGTHLVRNRGGVVQGSSRLTAAVGADDKLCRRCHRAFGDRAGVIFENMPKGAEAD